MNYSLEYRKSIVEAKRAWDKIKSNDGKKTVINRKSDIAKNVIRRQKELKIYGGGIAILSKAEGKPILLYSPDVQKHFEIKEDVAEYEYLYTPYDIVWENKGFENFIDLLFFVSRDTKYPEYVKNIQDTNKQNPFEYPFQFQLRKEYEILHCSTGEVLFFSLLWRLVIELVIKNDNLNIKYDKSLFKTKKNGNNWFSVFLKSKTLLDEKILIQKLIKANNDVVQTKDRKKKKSLTTVLAAKEYFLKSIKCDPSVDYIFEQLGLFNPKAMNELNKYIEHLFGSKFIKLTQRNADVFADRIILGFVKKTKQKTPNPSLKNLLTTLHQEARFPLLPYYFLMLFDTKKELKEHIVFPLWYTFSSDTKYTYGKNKSESAVLHALYTIKPIWEIKEYECKEWYTPKSNIISPLKTSDRHLGFESYLNDLFSLFTSMSKPIIDKEYYAVEAEKNIDLIKKQATKAAISQVMARNMSHNIGSHVLSKYKSKTDISNPITSQYKAFTNAVIEDPLLLASNFNEYLKNRMDYLADIATSDPVMENTMDFKSELMEGIDKNRVLLDRISGVTDNELVFEFCLKHKGVKIINDISLSITNDILGSQAFYIIIENIIRNIAKHSKLEKGEKKIEITINISDFKIDNISSEFYEVSIYDNILREEKAIEKIVLSRNTAFTESILIDNKLRDNNLGTIEMDVCAAYLRCLPITSVEINKFDLKFDSFNGQIQNNLDLNTPLLIFAYCQPDSIENMATLGYKFYLNKPKEVLVIDDEGSFRIKELTPQQLLEKGISVIKSNEIKPGKVFNHQLLYCYNNTSTVELISTDLPKRVVEKISDSDFDSPLHFLAAVWESYILNSKKIQLPVKLKSGIDDNEFIFGKSQKNHLELMSNDSTAKYKILLDNHDVNYDTENKYDYYDMACGHTKLLKFLTPLMWSSLDEFYRNSSIIKKCEYLEVVNTSIVIIDERIQDSIVNQNKLYSEKVPFLNYFKRQKIHIPTIRDANLNELSFGDLKTPNSISNNIKNYINSNEIKDSDFFVIHLGVIEKMLPANAIKSEEVLDDILKEIFFKINRNKIIVTSGRGNPNNLKSDISFVPIALIQNAIETTFDKIVLTKILYNARPSKK